MTIQKGSAGGHTSGQIGKPDPPVKTQDFLELYFQRFHRHWPFVHRGSFSPSNETPLLIQSMVAIGMWVSNVPKTQSAAIDLHQTLNEAIYQQRDKWDASIADNVSSMCTWPIPMYQAILLHIIFSLVSARSSPVGLDLKPSLPDIEAGLLASLVRSCRELGMFQYRNILARYKPGDLPTFVWVGVEEAKRFVIALFKVCSALSCDGYTSNLGECTTPEVLGWSFPASELQFPVPTHDLLWNAKGREEWMTAAEDVDCIDLGDMMESKWISKSANILRLV
ncbi:hypothetical protein HFD88_005695 [Aspergillus terreus]|nr:hypothetical protein HFD88_005695 [Aspergillus terreus]